MAQETIYGLASEARSGIAVTDTMWASQIIRDLEKSVGEADDSASRFLRTGRAQELTETYLVAVTMVTGGALHEGVNAETIETAVNIYYATLDEYRPPRAQYYVKQAIDASIQLLTAGVSDTAETYEQLEGLLTGQQDPGSLYDNACTDNDDPAAPEDGPGGGEDEETIGSTT